jgi:hypothetical protein
VRRACGEIVLKTTVPAPKRVFLLKTHPSPQPESDSSTTSTECEM